MSVVPEKDVNSDVNPQVRVREGISADDDAAAGAPTVVGGAASIDALGREQQRRATAWARARGQA